MGLGILYLLLKYHDQQKLRRIKIKMPDFFYYTIIIVITQVKFEIPISLKKNYQK